MASITYALGLTLLPQTDGTVAYVPPFPNTLKRGDGSLSQAGDILSVQPDGSLQTRPATAIGPWEKAVREGVALTYTGTGKTLILLPVQG